MKKKKKKKKKKRRRKEEEEEDNCLLATVTKFVEVSSVDFQFCGYIKT